MRYWHELNWRADQPDREPVPGFGAGNPHDHFRLRDFDGDEKRVEHTWSGSSLSVRGWDRALVKKVYGEQRAQYLARQEGIS